MHILNVMFSKGLGGIEQALVDYCEALKLEGHKVSAIIYPRARIKQKLLGLGVNIIEVKNFAAWDVLAVAYIKKVIKQLAPDAAILHGNRAISLMKKSRPSFPLIGVTHNYKIRRMVGLDAIFAITEDLRKTVISTGQNEGRVFKVPNMVRVDSKAPGSQLKFHKPIVIGTMGRFVKKKGFDVFLKTIAQLKSRGLEFKAILGGGGEEETNLKNLASELQLGDVINFTGWIENKRQFFESIDIFCLPSLHEPFGIILLEAFAHSKPVVTSDSEGPLEIVSDNEDALLVPKGNSKLMADAIMCLVNDNELTNKIAQNAFVKAGTYDIKHFAASLSGAIAKVLKARDA